jgi:hypothetical protein
MISASLEAEVPEPVALIDPSSQRGTVALNRRRRRSRVKWRLSSLGSIKTVSNRPIVSTICRLEHRSEGSRPGPVGVLSGGPLMRRGVRPLGIGAAAAVVTYGLGRLFGAIVG